MASQSLFTVPDGTVLELTEEHAEELQGLLEACEDYFELVFGLPVGPAEVQSAFMAVPEGKTYEDKLLLGVVDAEDRLNHSCDPNLWMEDEVTLSARRDIGPGEELTGDYALWEFDPDHICPFECRCGSAHCRGKITGRDWELPELQSRYAGHWHPSIQARITKA